jgi:autotransporter-associated beta strand protein
MAENAGNVLSLADANAQMNTFHDVNLSTSSHVWVARGALNFSGNSTVNIGGSMSQHGAGTDWAWGSLIIQDNASVNVTGGIEFNNTGANLAFNGGTLTTPGIWGNSFNEYGGSGTIFNGTRIIASQSNANFLKVSVNYDETATNGTAHLGTGGAIFDTNGFNITVAPPLVDLPGNAGILKKVGSGSLLLTGANTYSGGTIIEGGYIMVNGGTNGGNLGNGPVTLNGGGFKNNDSTPSIDTFTTLGPSGGYFTAGWNKYVSLVGQITGTGALNVNTDGGTVYLYNSSNNYEGATNIGTTGPGYFDQTTIAKLQLANSNVLPDGTTVNLLTAASLLNLNGNSETIGGLTGSGSVTLGAGSLRVGAENISSSFGGTITGSGQLVKLGTGTLTLSGNSNFAGGATVTAGGLTLNSGTGAGNGTIAMTGESSVLTVPSNVTLQNSVTLSHAGAIIERSVAGSGSYNVGTTGTLTSSFAGGKPDTAARILAGTNSGASTTLTMGFSDTSNALNDGLRRTDVFSLTGTTGTDAYVLQIVAAGLQSDSVLGWKNGSVWDWAVNGNTGNNATAAMRNFMGSFSAFQTAFGTNLNSYIGAFGYDANAGGTGVGGVWAVLNHNSEFSGIPELSNILAGLLLGAGLLRRRR